jgi:hypothetical protein
MAAEFVDRLAILVVVRRFPGMGADDFRSLRHDRYVRMQAPAGGAAAVAPEGVRSQARRHPLTSPWWALETP